MKNPQKLLNMRKTSKAVCVLDFHEGHPINEAALKTLMLEAVGLNQSKAHEPSLDESRCL
jgi:hypothetical protein